MMQMLRVQEVGTHVPLYRLPDRDQQAGAAYSTETDGCCGAAYKLVEARGFESTLMASSNEAIVLSVIAPALLGGA